MVHPTRLVATTVIASAIAALSVACKPNSMSSTTTMGACMANANSTTITISNNAVCPQNVIVSPGSQITFVNSDSRTHEMTSDPHPEHTDCPAINQVGSLVPGQTRQTGNLNAVRRCGFHDHIAFENAALKGSITIQ